LEILKMPMVFFDPHYLMFMLPALILAFWAQARVKSAYNKYSQIGNSSNLSGAEAAARMLEGMGVPVVASAAAAKASNKAVAIELTQGFLGDHYDPRERVLRLSPDVYNGRSIASVGIACHEAGHALQHAQGYAALELRSLMVPVAQFGSPLAMPLIVLGWMLESFALVKVGLILFSVIVLFQIVTLPVEFNASKRAKAALARLGIVQSGAEKGGVAAVLNAAAMTYVAAAVSSIMTLLYFLTRGSRR
jgi:uncharacterized protein